MTIESHDFGPVILTGEDAKAFARQVQAGPTPEQRIAIARAIRDGERFMLSADPGNFALQLSCRSWEQHVAELESEQ